jgi:hypothetical protein
MGLAFVELLPEIIEELMEDRKSVPTMLFFVRISVIDFLCWVAIETSFLPKITVFTSFIVLYLLLPQETTFSTIKLRIIFFS